MCRARPAVGAQLIISRYIAKQVLGSILIVLLLLVGIQSFIQLAAQLQDVGKGDYGLGQAFLFVPLMLPSDIYLLFPMAALIGSLIGLGRLAQYSELTVMRASGVSKAQVVRSVLIMASVLLILMTLIGELLGPFTRDIALNMKNEALSGGQTLSTKDGTWVRDHRDFLHIRNVLSADRIAGITRYSFDNDHHLVIASYSKEGKYADGRWTFYDVDESHFSPNHVQKQHYKELQWSFTVDPVHLGLQEVDPNQMNLVQLKDYIHFRKHGGLGLGIFEFVFWKRIFTPLSALVMILIAVPFIFGPLRSRPMGVRILSGIVAGFVFYILNQFLGPFSLVFEFPPIFAAAAPMVLFAMVGSYLLLFKN